MSDNDFDKAGRTCLHLDPPGILRWLLPGLNAACTFQRWADTRTLAFPGEPDRTCDTVAELLQTGEPPCDYAGLALVFSDLTKCRPLWARALGGWNVKRSEQVMEWQAETMAEAVIEALQLRFHAALPDELVTRIRATTDLALLKRWHAVAVTARSLNKFRQAMEA